MVRHSEKDGFEQPMTVLVTGATGLIGTRLIPRLMESGLKCRALVRSGKEGPPGATTFTADLLSPNSLVAAVQGVSAVIHLAAVFRTRDDDLIWKSNLQGTVNLIYAVKNHAPQARFLMASTAHVYDSDSPRPGHEDDIVDPKLAYPASKFAAEEVVRESGLL